jgi:glycosyltransferase involved in cell wall biosynthesis
VLVVSLGATAGLRAADDELLASLRRAGATAEMARVDPPAPVRTLMLTDLRWAIAARRATIAALRQAPARAIVYSSSTAALLWARPGAIRFDASAAGNRQGRHGLWQRPLERRRMREAPLLLPWSDGALRELPESARRGASRALVLPVPVEPSAISDRLDDREIESYGQSSCPKDAKVRDVEVLAYGANPTKKGLDRILDAWHMARKPSEEMVVAGASEEALRKLGYKLPAEGVRVLPMLGRSEYRALLRRTRVFASAARREDYGIAQLEALADGCMLVTTPSPGPYAALPVARELDERLVGEQLVAALRTALDEPIPDYAERALAALSPFRRTMADRLVADQMLSHLLGFDTDTGAVS